ncbi:hypothetical protein [Maricaulis parjimensis]|uniref:hypothetical protein n=1 Tax=Maricaulis parjimensis TaxID=144023 RepID=UPI00193A9FA2|nr:hypothetical protein [Maricaulis parjimensis]
MKQTSLKIVAAATVGWSLISLAQADTGLEIGMSAEAAQAQLDAQCDRLDVTHFEPSRHPSAHTSETHIRCEGFAGSNGSTAEHLLASFADGSLFMLEARGEMTGLVPDVDPAGNLGGYTVYLPHLIVTHAESGRWFHLSQMDQAPLALGWDNPAWSGERPAPSDTSFALPDWVSFGDSVETLSSVAEAACPLQALRDIPEIWLDTQPQRQQQLDCYGIEVAGYPRKLELVFGDGTLEQVWFMFGEADIPRARDWLTQTYGPALHVDEQYEIFDDWRVALRKDVPEIRAASDRLAAIWASEAE